MNGAENRKVIDRRWERLDESVKLNREANWIEMDEWANEDQSIYQIYFYTICDKISPVSFSSFAFTSSYLRYSLKLDAIF